MKKIYKTIIFLSALVFSCGVKSNPEPPISNIPKSVSDINIKQQGDIIVLYWEYDGLFMDNRKIPKFKQRIYLNGKNIKTYLHKYKNLYWIDYKYKKIGEELCFQIEIKTKKKSSFSKLKCIIPKPYKKIKDSINIKITKEGFLLKWKGKYENLNLYKGSDYKHIPPILYTKIENRKEFIDENVLINKVYCYYFTISENNIESNRIYSECKIFKDIFPPESPKNISYIKKDKKIIIIWSDPSSKDLKGFLIEKNGVLIVNIPVNTYYFIDKNPKKGDVYQIYAVDKAGNKSKPAYLKVE